MNKELINKTVETELNRFGMRKYTQGTFLISYFMYGGTEVDGHFIEGNGWDLYPRFADGMRTYDYTHSKECLDIAKKYGHTHYQLVKKMYLDAADGSGWMDMNKIVKGKFVDTFGVKVDYISLQSN